MGTTETAAPLTERYEAIGQVTERRGRLFTRIETGRPSQQWPTSSRDERVSKIPSWIDEFATRLDGPIGRT